MLIRSFIKYLFKNKQQFQSDSFNYNIAYAKFSFNQISSIKFCFKCFYSNTLYDNDNYKNSFSYTKAIYYFHKSFLNKRKIYIQK